MKVLSLVSTLAAVAYAVPTEMVAEGISADSPIRSTVNGEKILPRLDQLAAKDGAKRTTVPYGSWMVTNKMMMQQTKLAKGPCPTAGCYVTAMEATIRYPDKKEANVDTGAWLHHIALFGSGGGSGSIWAAGNERPTLRLNTESKYGLDFPQAFMLMIDLMTEDSKPKNLTLEIQYEWVPKTTAGYKAAAMYWLTIGEPAAKDGVYKFSSFPAVTSYAGKLLYSIGHMHDGGTDMRLFVNSKMVCKSVMHYNTRAGYTPHKKRDGPGGHGGKSAGEHISDPGACTDFGTVAPGDKLSAEAWYDSNKHPLMTHNGARERLMGNMRVYIGPN
jgi:hypothetical protein